MVVIVQCCSPGVLRFFNSLVPDSLLNVMKYVVVHTQDSMFSGFQFPKGGCKPACLPLAGLKFNSYEMCARSD
jgi:hypothetical protein